MNTTLTPVRSLDHHAHVTTAYTIAPRPSFADRLSLRLGLWLLLRGTRRLHRLRDHDAHAHALAAQRAADRRTRAADERLLLGPRT